MGKKILRKSVMVRCVGIVYKTGDEKIIHEFNVGNLYRMTETMFKDVYRTKIAGASVHITNEPTGKIMSRYPHGSYIRFELQENKEEVKEEVIRKDFKYEEKIKELEQFKMKAMKMKNTTLTSINGEQKKEQPDYLKLYKWQLELELLQRILYGVE